MTTQEKIKQKEAELQELRTQLENEKNDSKKFLLEILGNGKQWIADPGKFTNSIFFFKGEICLLELQKTKNTTYLWCSYSQIWNPISEKFSLNYASIQELIKETIEEHFKLSDVTPRPGFYPAFVQIEEHFKLSDVTPASLAKVFCTMIEEHFKLSDVTPAGIEANSFTLIEEHFKLSDVTPAIKNQQ